MQLKILSQDAEAGSSDLALFFMINCIHRYGENSFFEAKRNSGAVGED